jgi:hypothetical protein
MHTRDSGYSHSGVGSTCMSNFWSEGIAVEEYRAAGGKTAGLAWQTTPIARGPLFRGAGATDFVFQLAPMVAKYDMTAQFRQADPASWPTWASAKPDLELQLEAYDGAQYALDMGSARPEGPWETVDTTRTQCGNTRCRTAEAVPIKQLKSGGWTKGCWTCPTGFEMRLGLIPDMSNSPITRNAASASYCKAPWQDYEHDPEVIAHLRDLCGEFIVDQAMEPGGQCLLTLQNAGVSDECIEAATAAHACHPHDEAGDCDLVDDAGADDDAAFAHDVAVCCEAAPASSPSISRTIGALGEHGFCSGATTVESPGLPSGGFCGGGSGRPAGRVISDCHFAAQLNHFTPGFLSYLVAVLLKLQSDITPPAGHPSGARWAGTWGTTQLEVWYAVESEVIGANCGHDEACASGASGGSLPLSEHPLLL